MTDQPPRAQPTGSGVGAADQPVDGVPAIATRGLTKRYGQNTALHDVSIDIPAGAACGLIGPNGAGKSTLMSITSTLLRPSAGECSVFGHPTTDTATVRSLIGYVPDVLGTYDRLSVEEYLHFYAEAYRIAPEQRGPLVDELLDLVHLTTKRNADVNTLSRGMKQRIGLARGLVHRPRLLILDEPASGLDPRARVELRDLIVGLRDRGVTILVSSHILGELEEMCTHVAVLEQGQLVGFESLVDDVVRSVVVTFLDRPEETFRLRTDEEQAALVADLVARGLPVVGVRVVRTRIEDRFMTMTEGRLN